MSMTWRRWVIITGRGDSYVTFAQSAHMAMEKFQKRWAGLEIASCFEATEF